MKKVPLRKQSDKQREKNYNWHKVTLEKWGELNHVCQWCGQPTRMPDGHHIIKRRFNIHTKENCYVVAWTCHSFIELYGIDVTTCPTCNDLSPELELKWKLYIKEVIHY